MSDKSEPAPSEAFRNLPVKREWRSRIEWMGRVCTDQQDLDGARMDELRLQLASEGLEVWDDEERAALVLWEIYRDIPELRTRRARGYLEADAMPPLFRLKGWVRSLRRRTAGLEREQSRELAVAELARGAAKATDALIEVTEGTYLRGEDGEELKMETAGHAQIGNARTKAAVSILQGIGLQVGPGGSRGGGGSTNVQVNVNVNEAHAAAVQEAEEILEAESEVRDAEERGGRDG